MSQSTFSELQRCDWQYGSIFIRLAVVASQICKILWKFKLIAVQGHRAWLQWKAHMQLPISHTNNNNKFGWISYHFRDIDAFSSKIACFTQNNNTSRVHKCLHNWPWTVLGCRAGDEVAAPLSLVCWQTAERKQHTDCHGTTPKPVHSSTPDRSWISPSLPPPRWVSDSAVPTIWHRTA